MLAPFFKLFKILLIDSATMQVKISAVKYVAEVSVLLL